MSEIFQERLEVHRHRYMGDAKALEEAMDLSVDAGRFTSEQMEANLLELQAIADARGLGQYYLGVLWDKVLKEERIGEDF